MQTWQSAVSALGASIEYERRRHAPSDERRRRVIDGCARCYVLATDRPLSDRQTLWSLTEPVGDAQSRWWDHRYRVRLPECGYVMTIRRRDILDRIAKGGLGIEDRLGVWDGGFWAGLRMSGALRQGPGTEFYVWERGHADLVADMSSMPAFGRLEPRVSQSGLRRLRRCYATFLPPVDPMGRSVLAGMFAGAALAAIDGDEWLSLPDDEAVRAVLADWSIPATPTNIRGRHRLIVSPFFGVLFSHMMPVRSARRILCIRNPAQGEFLAAVFWDRVLSRKGQRHAPFAGALPWAASRATFFRRGWRRLDLHRTSTVDMGIPTISPKLREVVVEWYERRSAERLGRTHDPAACPMPPDIGIPVQRLPPSTLELPPPGEGRCGCWERCRR